ncbi:MAG TPA: glycosyltransferase [Actinomycetota bacterium]|jgi:glycosyltransferase involved in cell wall biosynthesis|nr:glycosyltransferase [Actinomycetota bacterium]
MHSGIADYSYELLPVLARSAEVDAFCPKPGRFRRPKVPDGITWRVPEELSSDGYDAVYHHLGNNPWHEFVYETALVRPGIFVFHDLSLHHLIAHLMVERGFGVRQRDRYEQIFDKEYGPELGARIAALKIHGVASDLEKFLFPLTAHMARRARGIVVHSTWAAEQIGPEAPGTPVEVIPHHAGAPPPDVVGVDRAEARRRLGLPEDAFIVGHFGFVTRPKQPEAVIGGMARLHRAHPDSLLVVVGADNTGGGLDRIIDRHDVRDAVRPVGFVGLTKFYLYLKAVDAVINLRYPSAGESSGSIARALAEGRAVICNKYHAFAELPGDAVLKVEIDRPQADQVGDHLIRLAADPQFKESVEARARDYAETVLDQQRCASLYLSFADRVAAIHR